MLLCVCAYTILYILSLGMSSFLWHSSNFLSSCYDMREVNYLSAFVIIIAIELLLTNGGNVDNSYYG